MKEDTKDDGNSRRPTFATAAIIKGLIEHDDPRRHFGSTLGFSWHLDDAQRLSMIEKDDSGKWSVTEYGREYYSSLDLASLPDCRAVYWGRTFESWTAQ